MPNNTLHADPFCDTARTIEQNIRYGQSLLAAGMVAPLVGIGVAVVVSVAVGAPTGPAAPIIGTLAGITAGTATTAGILYAHAGLHNMIDQYQNRRPATAPEGLSCKQYLGAAAMESLHISASSSTSGFPSYQGTALQKILHANPAVLDQILASPVHYDPMNPKSSKEEKQLRGFAASHPAPSIYH